MLLEELYHNSERMLSDQFEEKKELSKILKRMNMETKVNLKLTRNLIMNELLLQRVTNEIRAEWIKSIAQITANWNLAPWEGQIPKDTDGNDIKFTYERLLHDTELSKKFESNNKFGKNKLRKIVLYNNGMAAFRGTIDIIDILTKDVLKIGKSVGYFETRIYLESLINKGIASFEIEDDNSNNCNVFIFEPIKYLLRPTVTNMDKLISRINASTAKTIFLILDSTLHSDTELFSKIEDKLSEKKKIIFISFRSGIKLDQQGLEIGHLGIVTWYINQENRRYAENAYEFIETYKGVLGDNITYNKLVSLEIFSAYETKKYTNKIISICKEFVESLKIESHEYIEKVIYPQFVYDGETLNMPFLFIKFQLQTKAEYERLMRNIIDICEMNGVFLPYRNSFGFRFPSIEYICDYQSGENVIKLCLGVYRGVLYELLLYILCDLGNSQKSKVKEMICRGIGLWQKKK